MVKEKREQWERKAFEDYQSKRKGGALFFPFKIAFDNWNKKCN